jgi:uncharacterized protein YcbK (DUF882 family)
MLQLTDHLHTNETACRCGCGLGTRLDDYAPQLLALFENLRAAAGDVPLYVRSGWRCAAHNGVVGGSPRSNHLHGLALDLCCPALRAPMGAAMRQVAAAIGDELPPTWSALLPQLPLFALATSSVQGVRGVGLYVWGVHIDLGEARRPARWVSVDGHTWSAQ